MAQEVRVAAFGEELRRAREERGVTFETMCEATKVSAKHIRALEAGALGELPGGVFRRGFVRSYLKELGLKEDEWMKRFEQSCRESGMSDPAEMEWVAFAENVKNNRAAPRRRIGMRRVGIAILLALLAVAGWCGWRLATHRRLFPVLRSQIREFSRQPWNARNTGLFPERATVLAQAGNGMEETA